MHTTLPHTRNTHRRAGRDTRAIPENVGRSRRHGGAPGRRGEFSRCGLDLRAAIARWPDGFITLRWLLRLIYDSAKIGWKIGCSSAPAT
jgi:hypothetical protein